VTWQILLFSFECNVPKLNVRLHQLQIWVEGRISDLTYLPGHDRLGCCILAWTRAAKSNGSY
jgi:hypothetical protein